MERERLLELFASSADLPVSVYQADRIIFTGHKDRPDFGLPLTFRRCLKAGLPEIWTCHTPEHLFFGGFALEDDQELLLGPVSVYEPSLAQCEQILRHLGRRPSEAATLQQVIRRFGQCDILHLRNHLRLLYQILREKEAGETADVEFRWKELAHPLDEYYLELPQIDGDDLEKNMTAFIRNGKVTELENYFNEVFLANNEADVSTRNLELRRTFISGANMLFSRLAIQEGVDEHLARFLSGFYVTQLMEARTLTDLSRIFYQMAVDYAKRIRQVSEIASEEYVTMRISGYIHAHIREPLSTAVIAEAFHRNEAYLSARFKKETGRTITDYIRECKTREARFLLEMGCSAAEVSDRLAFSSASYFGRVFRETTGMTPAAYQKSVKKS